MARPRTHPCGTAAAYAWHRWHGTEPCPEDVAAWRADNRRRRAAHPARPRAVSLAYARASRDLCREHPQEFRRLVAENLRATPDYRPGSGSRESKRAYIRAYMAARRAVAAAYPDRFLILRERHFAAQLAALARR